MTALTMGPLLYSSLGDDPDLAEIVEMFVEELPRRIEGIVAATQQRNWAEVGRLAHQIKGAGGSHGFDQMTKPAAIVEDLARHGSDDASLESAVATLVDICSRVRSGVPL